MLRRSRFAGGERVKMREALTLAGFICLNLIGLALIYILARDYIVAAYWWVFLRWRREVLRLPYNAPPFDVENFPWKSDLFLTPCTLSGEAEAWCRENCSGRVGVAPVVSLMGFGLKRQRSVWFENANDRFLFQLRWR